MAISLLLLAQPVTALLITQPNVVPAIRLGRVPRRCTPIQLSDEPMTMRAAEIKAELMERQAHMQHIYNISFKPWMLAPQSRSLVPCV